MQRRHASVVFKWIAMLLLVSALGFAATASACNQQDGSVAEWGERVGKDVGKDPAKTYKYVADRERQLYWPNKPAYVSRIPEGRRVWIKDQATLAQFKGYKPGPL